LQRDYHCPSVHMQKTQQKYSNDEKGAIFMTAYEFFKALYTGIDKRQNKIQILLIDPTKERGQKGYITWRFFSSIDDAVNYANQMEKEQRYHVYFRCPELVKSSTTGKKEDIACHTFLFSDIDSTIKDKDGNIVRQLSKEALLQKIDSFPLSPTIVVDSGNGYHIYWKLTIPLYEKERVQYLLSSIQEFLGGDPRATLLTQLLRVPNTHNRKGEAEGKEPALVKVVKHNKKNIYTPNDFFIALDLKEEDVYSLKSTISSPSSAETGNSSIYTGGDVITFDFNKRIEPVNIKVDNFIDLLETIKKQNILLASNIDPSYLGRTFKCCFHKDESPSANVFISRNGHYLYKCFGCNRIYDIVSIYKTITKKSFTSCLKDLADFFGIKYEQSQWAIDQINKYHQNLVTLMDFEKYDYEAIYPNFYKLLKNRSHYLYFLNSFGLGALRSEKESYQGESIFRISYNYFTKTFSSNRVTYITTLRYINLFCTLGLIKKVPINEVPKHMAADALKHMEKIAEFKESDKISPVNFYIVYNIHDRMKIADDRAKVLLKNGFRISKTMNKDYLIITFGQAVADEVYPDERTKSKRSESIANRLETTLAKLVSEQGYATKDQVVSKTKLSGRLKADRKKKEAELEKNFAQMLNRNNLEYIRPNKELMETFKLKKATFIIVPRGAKK
jgi:hypothetical protein